MLSRDVADGATKAANCFSKIPIPDGFQPKPLARSHAYAVPRERVREPHDINGTVSPRGDRFY